jgi:head-tail adaptor
MAPSANRRSCLVIFQRETTDTSGEYDVTAWETVSDAWVAIDPNRGREIFSQNELEAVVSHTIRGDYLDLEAITEKMRMIYHESHVYEPIPAKAEVYDLLAVMADKVDRSDIMIQASIRGRRYEDL